jgi:DNA-binding MarR family transcriptional regulator
MAPERRPELLTDAHMLVLGWIRGHPLSLPGDIAAALDWPVTLVTRLCADLQAAGMIAPATTH